MGRSVSEWITVCQIGPLCVIMDHCVSEWIMVSNYTTVCQIGQLCQNWSVPHNGSLCVRMDQSVSEEIILSEWMTLGQNGLLGSESFNCARILPSPQSMSKYDWLSKGWQVDLIKLTVYPRTVTFRFC